MCDASPDAAGRRGRAPRLRDHQRPAVRAEPVGHMAVCVLRAGSAQRQHGQRRRRRFPFAALGAALGPASPWHAGLRGCRPDSGGFRARRLRHLPLLTPPSPPRSPCASAHLPVQQRAARASHSTRASPSRSPPSSAAASATRPAALASPPSPPPPSTSPRASRRRSRRRAPSPSASPSTASSSLSSRRSHPTPLPSRVPSRPSELPSTAASRSASSAPASVAAWATAPATLAWPSFLPPMRRARPAAMCCDVACRRLMLRAFARRSPSAWTTRRG